MEHSCPSSLFAKHLLTQQGWQSDVLLQLDDTGTITSRKEHSSPQNDSLQSDMLVPGMPNLHSHSFQYAMAGLAEQAGTGEDHFWSWRDWMYRFASRIQPEQLHVIAKELYIRMLKAGYSSVGEFHYLHHQPDGTPYDNHAELSLQVIDAATDAGLPITHLPVLYAYSDVGAQAPTEGQRRFTHTAEEFIRLWIQIETATKNNDRIQMGIAPHSLRATTPELVNEVLDALPNGIPTHIHIAEQIKEVEAVLAFNNTRPVQWLLDRCDVNAHWCIIHATHMDEMETKTLAATGAVAGLCPLTEANLGDGIFPMVSYHDAAGQWGIGSDSHILLSPFEELRMLDYSQRLNHQQRLNIAPPQRFAASHLWMQAVHGGQQALAISNSGLEKGNKLDAIALSLNHPLYAGRNAEQCFSTALYALPQPNIAHVFAQGQHLIKDGKHMHEDDSATTFRTIMQSLL